MRNSLVNNHKLSQLKVLDNKQQRMKTYQRNALSKLYNNTNTETKEFKITNFIKQ